MGFMLWVAVFLGTFELPPAVSTGGISHKKENQRKNSEKKIKIWSFIIRNNMALYFNWNKNVKKFDDKRDYHFTPTQKKMIYDSDALTYERAGEV